MNERKEIYRLQALNKAYEKAMVLMQEELDYYESCWQMAEDEIDLLVEELENIKESCECRSDYEKDVMSTYYIGVKL